MMPNAATLRTMAGVLVKDLPLYMRHLWLPGGDYLAVRNRNEHLEGATGGRGYRCAWRWTSDLHAPRHIPALGRALLRRALAEHPIRLADEPRKDSARPEVSFIIGHRGTERIGNLLLSLASLAAQEGVGIECVVVEQDDAPLIPERLPGWVRYVHMPLSQPGMPYCRAAAFNVGAAHARSDVLVLHDNDLLVPANYAAEIARVVREGWQVVNLKRFIFYFSREETRAAIDGANLESRTPETIMQNAEGGGSIAITRDAFDSIGGMDESFVGWGGEDNEFWDRAQTQRVWPFGSMPLVHLWHSAQPGKQVEGNVTLDRYATLSRIPAEVRIAALRDARPHR